MKHLIQQETEINHLHPLCYEENYLFSDADGELYLIDDETYHITSHPYEPCLYIAKDGEIIIAIHNAFNTREICGLTEKGGTIRMISGQEYDLKGICELLRYAIDINESSMDLSYLEGRRFIHILSEHGAFSDDKAISLEDCGLRNHCIMDRFIHAKKIIRTADGRYYVTGGYPD